MAKLRSIVVAAWFWALAFTLPHQVRAESLRAKMDEDPSVQLYTVEFRSRLDHHGRLLSLKIVKVIDGKSGKSVRLKVSRDFIAVARQRIEQDLALPHASRPPAYTYNAFLYSPAFPDILFMDPDRDIKDQAPEGAAPKAAAPAPQAAPAPAPKPAAPKPAAPPAKDGVFDDQLELQF